jgi:hypothetical protein
MIARFPTKAPTAVPAGTEIQRLAPSGRGRGRRLTAKHKGRTLPQAVADNTLVAATSRAKRK